MTRADLGRLCALALLATTSGTAAALTLTVTPKDARVGQGVTLTVQNLGFPALIYQVSADGGKTWHSIDGNGRITSNSASVWICYQQPCRLIFQSPDRETALEFRVAVWNPDPRARQWVFGSKTNQLASWTVGQGGGTDLAADFNWNREMGGFVIGVSPGAGNLTGSFAGWRYTGRASNGADVVCEGGLNPGIRVADDAPGWIKCKTKWGTPPIVWACQGPGRIRTSWSAYAGGWAWFGSGQCAGTITEAGKPRNHTFGPVYLRSRLGL